ncbi:MAG TPA: PD-(D/E)XK nuclease family protein, partial [Methanocorpusculum sp.]|nr:PD-(D/E)XK nuclease family protein [Methanocorpusculum sp.]
KAEMEGVLEQIASLLEGGVSPEDILILSPSVAETELLLRETVPYYYYRKDGKVHAIPYVCHDKGLLFSTVPPVQALLAALEIATGNCTKENLSTLVASPYFPQLQKGITPGKLSEISLISGLPKTRGEWEKAAERVAENEHRNIRYKSAKEQLEKIFEYLKPLTKGETYRTRYNALFEWLKESGWVSMDFGFEYEDARRKLMTIFETITKSEVSDIPCTYHEFIQHLQFIVKTKNTTRCGKSGVRLAELPQDSSLKRDYVFITGMTAARIPTQTTIVPPFSEQETEELFERLMMNSLENHYFQFANALKTAKKGLWISCSRESGAKNTTPSTFMMMLGDVINKTVVIRHSSRYNQIRAGQALSGKIEKISDTVGLTDMASVYTRALAEANNTYSADFSGTELEKEFNNRYSNQVQYAPTTIEEYLRCPFKWYLDKHLRLYTPNEDGSESVIIGSLVHKSLERFFKEFSECITQENIPKAKKHLLKIVAEEFGKYRIETPSWIATQDWYLGREKLPTPFEKLIDQEAESTSEGWTTDRDSIEYKFNNTKVCWKGQSIITNGHIDRIQKKGNEFRIIDYKTGNSFEKVMKRLVQIPLYMEAFKEKTGMHPEGGTYYKITKNEVVLKSPFNKRKTVENVMEEIMNNCFESRDGMFHGKCNRIKKCEDIYCPFKRVCRENLKNDDEEEEKRE